MIYRFQNVEVDTSRQTVRVGGAEVICQPRVYLLLVALCEARGAVVPRQDIFARLWKGQAIASDESLTQVVHRLRAALGPASSVVRTVRGVGFRLDCVVEAATNEEKGSGDGEPPSRPAAPVPTLPVLPQSPPLSPSTLSAPLSPSSTSARWRPARARRRWWVLVVLALAFAAGWLAVARPWQVIDPRFALRRGDLEEERRQTVDLVARALAAERSGDRAQARQLLATADQTDARSPVPAAFLCLFSPTQDRSPEAAHWAAEAESRLRPDSSPYLHLLVAYVRAQTAGQDQDWLAAASALLTLRPSAWYLRLARAHFHLSHREVTAALDDLRQIPIPALNDHVLAIVLADRASLGDVAGAERDLASGRLHDQEALAWYVRGRIARSRRHAGEALAAFDHELDLAVRQNQPDLILDARFFGSLAACEKGDLADCASRFDLTVALARAERRNGTAADALALGAYLSWRRGDPAGRNQRLADAANLGAEPAWAYRTALALLALWTGAPPPYDARLLAAQMPKVPELTGVDQLLAGRLAWSSGDRQEALRHLRRARAEGVDKTYFREESDLLAADLGEVPRAQWIDPPYPNCPRFAAAWELDRRAGLPHS